MTATPEFVTVFPGILAGQPTLLVNARDLHAFLEVGRDFSNWIKDRIEDYGFTVDQDFGLFAKTGENSDRGRGRPSKDYHITLGMAKELAMVERTEKGRAIRRYFIECERLLMQRAPEAIPASQPCGPAMAEEYITPTQYLAMKHKVWSIGQCFHTPNSGAMAAYRVVREHLGVSNAAKIPANKFEEVMEVLTQVESEAQCFKHKVIDAV